MPKLGGADREGLGIPECLGCRGYSSLHQLWMREAEVYMVTGCRSPWMRGHRFRQAFRAGSRGNMVVVVSRIYRKRIRLLSAFSWACYLSSGDDRCKQASSGFRVRTKSRRRIQRLSCVVSAEVMCFTSSQMFTAGWPSGDTVPCRSAGQRNWSRMERN